jgi:hypothetical protein
MSTENIVLFLAILFLIGVIVYVYRYLPRSLKHIYFVKSWKKIQANCKDKANWPKALSDADDLLKQALKKKRYKGKSMGEKMVSAQRLFTDNDSLWYAHNLYKKVIASEGKKKLKESEVKDALIGYRQALRDLGALPKDGTSKA